MAFYERKEKRGLPAGQIGNNDGSGGLKAVRGKNLFLYLSRVHRAGVYEDKILQLLAIFGSEQMEVFEHGNHAGTAVEMTWRIVAFSPLPQITTSRPSSPGKITILTCIWRDPPFLLRLVPPGENRQELRCMMPSSAESKSHPRVRCYAAEVSLTGHPQKGLLPVNARLVSAG